MARPAAFSVTDVETVAKRLAATNQQVTAYRVQRALGGGSFAWVKQSLEQLGFGADYGLPEGLDPDSAELIRLVQPLVDRLNGRVREEMDQTIERHAKDLAKLREELTNVTLSRDALSRSLKAGEEKQAATEKQLEQARAEISALKAEVQSVKDTVKERDGEVKAVTAQKLEADKRAESLQANLDTFRVSTKEQLDALRASHAEEMQSVQRQLLEQKNLVTLSREEVMKLNKQNSELLNDKVQLQSNARSLQTEFDAMLDKLSKQKVLDKMAREKLTSTETQLGEAKTQLAVDQQQLKTSKEQTDKLQVEVTTLQKASERQQVLLEQLIDALPEAVAKKQAKLLGQLLPE